MDFPAQLSPELALVDPELAARARARLPDHAVVSSTPRPRSSVERTALPRRLTRAVEYAVLLGVVLFALVVVTAMAAHEVRAQPTLAGDYLFLLPCPC